MTGQAASKGGHRDRNRGSGSNRRGDERVEECWSCKEEGHVYTECPKKITDRALLQRPKNKSYETTKRRDYCKANKVPLEAAAKEGLAMIMEELKGEHSHDAGTSAVSIADRATGYPVSRPVPG